MRVNKALFIKSDIGPVRVIEFSEFKVDNITCTGLTFDPNDKTFWIADHGKLPGESLTFPKLIKVNDSFSTVLSELSLSDILTQPSNLQGISYDTKDNTIWLATGDQVIEITTSGEKVNSLELNDYFQYQANGISYDKEDDSIWVLCAYKYLLHCKKDGQILNEFSFDVEGQDHICIEGKFIFITVGIDYHGINNFVYKVDKKTGETVRIYRILGSNAVEGICVHEDALFVSNDGFFHFDNLGKSYICEYCFSDFR